jgi:hypothetical protein
VVLVVLERAGVLGFSLGLVGVAGALGVLGLAVVVAGVVVAVWSWLDRPSPAEVASEVDAGLGLDDALASAHLLARAPGGGPFEVAAIEAGEQVAARVAPADLRRAMPIVWTRRWVAPALVLTAGVAVAIVLPQGWWSRGVQAMAGGKVAKGGEVEGAKQEVQLARQILQAVQTPGEDAGVFAPNPLAPPTAQTTPEAKALEALQQQLENGSATPSEARQQVAQAVEQAAERLEDRAKEAEAASAALRDRLAEMQRLEKGNQRASELARALRRGDLDGAGNAAEELGKAFESMPMAERERLAEELRKLAEDLKKTQEDRSAKAGENSGTPADGAALAASTSGEPEAEGSGQNKPVAPDGAQSPQPAEGKPATPPAPPAGMQPGEKSPAGEESKPEGAGKNKGEQKAEREIDALRERLNEVAKELQGPKPPQPSEPQETPAERKGEEPGKRDPQGPGVTGEKKPSEQPGVDRKSDSNPAPKSEPSQGNKPESKPGGEGKAEGKPGEKPGEKPSEQPGEKQGEQQSDNPAGTQGEKPSGPSAEKSQGQQSDKGGGKPQSSPGGEPGSSPGEKGDRSREGVKEQPGTGPESRPSDRGASDPSKPEPSKSEPSLPEPGKSEPGSSKGSPPGQQQEQQSQQPGESAAPGQGEAGQPKPGQDGAKQPGQQPTGTKPGQQPGQTPGEWGTPGVERLREQIDALRRSRDGAKQDRQDAQRLREQAQRMWEDATPGQRQELEQLAREMARNSGREKKTDQRAASPQAGEGKPDRPGANNGQGSGPSTTGLEPMARSGGPDGGTPERGGAGSDKPSRDGQVGATEPASPTAPTASASPGDAGRTIAEWLSNNKSKPASPAGPPAAVSDALRQAGQSAEQAIEQRVTPPRLNGIIRKYFDRLPGQLGVPAAPAIAPAAPAQTNSPGDAPPP